MLVCHLHSSLAETLSISPSETSQGGRGPRQRPRGPPAQTVHLNNNLRLYGVAPFLKPSSDSEQLERGEVILGVPAAFKCACWVGLSAGGVLGAGFRG